jgi:uracil-DNA glycosylase
MESLLSEIRACTLCQAFLPLGPNPILSAHANSRIAIIGQAPGIKVHESGIAWNDKSGDRLRDWLGVSKESFYNPAAFAIVPMGFCYPGKGKSGDLPPRPECAPAWHEELFAQMKNIQLTLLVGSYAQGYYLKETQKRTLTETVQNFREYLPEILVLPHPSPRNNIWLRKNPWFEEELLPELREQVGSLIKN